MRLKVDKDFTFRDDVFSLVDKCCETGMVLDINLPDRGPKKKRETKGKVQ